MTVEDDGRGISLADRCRLFQPFFTTKPHGTGLGLFVSRQILEEIAGTLDYRPSRGRARRSPSASPPTAPTAVADEAAASPAAVDSRRRHEPDRRWTRRR